MQMQDLIKPIEDMTQEELIERLQQVRAMRTTLRPAGKARAKRGTAKKSKTKLNKVDNLLAGLSQAELLQLLESLNE
jgi:hypothetical protein